jgi:hypothetical protein
MKNALAFYNAGVGVVNSKVVGLGPGYKTAYRRTQHPTRVGWLKKHLS